MAPIKTSLKKAFIVVDVIIGILGTIWLMLSLFLHGVYHSEAENDTVMGIQTFSVMYAIAVGIIVMSALALYGILKKKQWPVIVFAVGMSVVSVLFLVVGVPSAIVSTKVEDWAAMSFGAIDLHEGEDYMKEHFDKIQTELHCCGRLNGVSDWGSATAIPKSCYCPSIREPSMQCTPVTIKGEEVSVYEQPCVPMIISAYKFTFVLMTAVTFTYFLFVILGLALAIAVLCQMRRRTTAPPVSFTTHQSDAKYSMLDL